MTTLGGVLPVLSTPFTDTDVIDRPALRREVAWLLDAGADGVTVAMVSEILRLDNDERMRLADEVLLATADAGHVVLSVGAESTRQSLRLVAHAIAAEATAVMANPPLVSSPDDALLLAHLRTLAEASGATPLIVQDASGYVGRPIPLSVMISLFERYGPDKIQFKPEAEPLGPRLTALREATGGAARVYEGSGGRSLVESHQRGVVGTMPGADLVWAIVPLWRALQRGDLTLAYDIQEALSPILGLVSSLDSYVAVEKHLLVAQGVLSSASQRGPVDFVLDAATEGELATLVGRLSARVTAAASTTGS